MRSTYRFHENVNHLFEYGVDAAGSRAIVAPSSFASEGADIRGFPELWWGARQEIARGCSRATRKRCQWQRDTPPAC